MGERTGEQRAARERRAASPWPDDDVDALLSDLRERSERSLSEGERWELLLQAVVGMASDLSLDSLLERLVKVAGVLAEARYAALGVVELDGPERALRTFVHTGMPPDVVAGIDHLPEGHGLLGEITDRRDPLRLSDLSTHPVIHGFPAGHPPMRSFLGVPVRTREKVFGNLYLTEKVGGEEFTDEDERIVVALASAAGVAIENAELYDQARRRERWLSATAEITGALLGPMAPDLALQLVADRAREVASADAVWIVSGPVEGVEEFRLNVVSGMDVDVQALQSKPLGGSISHAVAARGTPLVVEDLASNEQARRTTGDIVGFPVLGPAMFVPLSPASGFLGVLGLGWSRERAAGSRDLDPALPLMFAEHVALSLQVLRAQVDQQRLALFEDRDRIGRDLHDLVIQRLFALGLSLQGAVRLTASAPLRAKLEQAVDELDGTIKDIRATIFELSSGGSTTDVKEEIIHLVGRAAATLKFQPTLVFEGPVSSVVDADTAVEVFAVLTELLSNAARHARATRVSVRVGVARGIEVEVVDDGIGIPEETTESGLANLRRRAERRGGTCRIGRGEEGRGSRVVWTVPAR